MIKMLDIKVITLKYRGLINPIKVKHVSNLLTKEHPQVVFLQETHIKKAVCQLLKSNWFLHQFQASGLSTPLWEGEAAATEHGKRYLLRCA